MPVIPVKTHNYIGRILCQSPEVLLRFQKRLFGFLLLIIIPGNQQKLTLIFDLYKGE